MPRKVKKPYVTYTGDDKKQKSAPLEASWAQDVVESLKHGYEKAQIDAARKTKQGLHYVEVEEEDED